MSAPFPVPDRSEPVLAREMLAAGVVVAGFEARFERAGGLVSDDFHRDWEAAVAGWWELAARYEGLEPRTAMDRSNAHAASIVRMFKPPHGLLF